MRNMSNGWNFDNTYARLPDYFFARLPPTPVKEPRMALFNHGLAKSFGLDGQALAARPEFFSGNEIPPGAEPISQAYAGHQFGHFTMLGDGRSSLLGEQITPAGERFDIQLKGSGPTPFSRRGDGRAALGPMLREYLVSEAMFALGIPTTRSLAVVTTGEEIYREMVLPGAILTRVAASHIRVGTFEYAAASRKPDAVKILADYTIQRHYPELAQRPDRYRGLLLALMESQASLIAQWMHVGFIHGVMNTDNMALSGETIDYGPCAFMDAFSPATVFSSIDRNGRYAYGNQPRIAQWNLARFAETMLSLFDPEEEKAVAWAKEAIEGFPALFARHSLARMRAKLGFSNEEEGDLLLIQELMQWMEKHQADYTNTFRALSTGKIFEEPKFSDEQFKSWHARWLGRSPDPARMLSVNPSVIPRNHRVEEALAAAERGDYSVLEKLLAVLARPYDDLPGLEEYRVPMPNGEYQTFCGT
jgi:uncharacterized protein YdiU (UPF0061 family)